MGAGCGASGEWFVVGGESKRAGAGLIGAVGLIGAGDCIAGIDVNAGNAISACVAGSGGEDGFVSDASAGTERRWWFDTAPDSASSGQALRRSTG